ncbi:MAG: D-tyrosyl-tRNA(Tyr) deacylase [Candidatus Cloacimonetes bacterium]|nr:D-tyrosyl-tRNA(Tyr) deacylase [Candidatus Cloacimonadota bacterium]
MRLLIQRVSESSLTIDSILYSRISRGLLVLIGITHSDTTADSARLAKKLVELRIFEDANGKMNLSLLDVDAEVMLVSQFTLYADCRRGRRPDFISAAPPVKAEELYNAFIDEVKQFTSKVATGKFAADMQISLVNEGPVTLLLDSMDI